MEEHDKLPTQTKDQDGLSAILFESLLATSPDAIVVTDSENKILHWSPAAESLFGYSRDAAHRKSIALIVPIATLQQLRNGSADESLIEGTTSDGAIIPLGTKFGESVDSEKNLVAITYFFNDLRPTLKQEESIKEKIRALEAFSYSVSHDLRAPLRRIINYAEILQEDHLPRLDEEVQRLISRMSRNAQKMSELIDDLLAFSRVGQQALQKITVNMEVLAKALVNEHKNSVEGSPIDFTIEELEPSQGDPTLLRQVFENLISNAIKYSAPKTNPKVLIGCIRGSNETTYFIRDNGVGFDMQYAPKLFNVFQRLHNPTEFEGTGIGLAIVHQIISRHGGTVRAEATLDGGATFFFSLPK